MEYVVHLALEPAPVGGRDQRLPGDVPGHRHQAGVRRLQAFHQALEFILGSLADQYIDFRVLVLKQEVDQETAKKACTTRYQ